MVGSTLKCNRKLWRNENYFIILKYDFLSRFPIIMGSKEINSRIEYAFDVFPRKIIFYFKRNMENGGNRLVEKAMLVPLWLHLPNFIWLVTCLEFRSSYLLHLYISYFVLHKKPPSILYITCLKSLTCLCLYFVRTHYSRPLWNWLFSHICPLF